jgi:outer membrane protein
MLRLLRRLWRLAMTEKEKKVPGTLSIAMTICIFFFLALPVYSGHCADQDVARLSLSDVLKIAILNNLDIKLAELDNKIGSADFMYSKAIFDTTITGEVTYEDDSSDSASSFAGTRSRTNLYKVGLEKKLPTGATFETAWSNTRSWTDSAFVTTNPYHTAEWSLSITQPVLRNFMGMQDWADIMIAQIDVKNSDIDTKDRIEEALSNTEKHYWQVVYAYKNLEVEIHMLDKANELLEVSKRNLKTGLIEKGDLLGSEANVRIRENSAMLAHNNLQTAINNLKLLLNERDDTVTIEPLDQLVLEDKDVSLPECLRCAFKTRRDYEIKKNELKSKKITLQMKRNNLWPEVDLIASLALNGVDRKPYKAAGRTTIGKNPNYYGGIKVSMSLENNEARAEHEKAKNDKIKSITELQKLEREIITDVDEKVRNVLTQSARAERAVSIRKIQSLKLQEEEKRYKYGRSSSKTLIDYQNDLLAAELEEARAILDFKVSVVDLERAQNKILYKVGLEK